MKNVMKVDWSIIPTPVDDGAAKHLPGQKLPNLNLATTDGNFINLSALKGCTVIYIYPRTARPDMPSLEGWDMIPGAKGCTPQSCAFRDHFDELCELNVDHLFGLSTQDSKYQAEAVERLHLPFPLLSDEQFIFAKALNLPMFEASNITLLKRLTMVIQDGLIEHVFYPVFPPDQNTKDVIKWLHSRLVKKKTPICKTSK